MDDLILTINKLQHFNNTYQLTELQLPQIIVVGSQSSGKSSVMERIIGHDILPKDSKAATLCPIYIQLVHQEYRDENGITGKFLNDTNTYFGEADIEKQLNKRTNSIRSTTQGISEDPIMLELRSHDLPTLTVIDLPGIIKNDGELPIGSKDKITQLSENFASQNNSIILAISAANVDLANSDSIAIARKYDKEGKRTLNVITKIDLMDKGTNITQALHSPLLRPSLGTICVVNRSQESVKNKKSIATTNDEEKDYFKREYSNISGSHGVEVLVKKLVHRLDDEIRKNIPDIEGVINRRLDILQNDLKEADSTDKSLILHSEMTKFIREYKKIVMGDREHYEAKLIGGARISMALYTDFEKEINGLAVTPISKEKLFTLIKNTTGNKRMSYSVEKPFIVLIKEEIEQFKNPSIACNDRIFSLLKEFVVQVIDEFNFRKYDYLATNLQSEMTSFIGEKHAFTKRLIEDMIRCEKEDIFFLRPNSETYNNLKGIIDGKVEGFKKKAFEKMLGLAASGASLVLPPQLRLLVNVANSMGALGALKDVASGLLPSGHQARPPPATRNPTGPAMSLNDIISKEKELQDNKTNIIDFLSSNPQFPGMLDVVMNNAKQGTSESEGDGLSTDAKVLKTMVKEYFEEVRKNVILNVPKWIQTIFVNDVLDGFDKYLFCLGQKHDLNDLLSIDKSEEDRIQAKRDELEELKSISGELRRIKLHSY